MFWRLPHSLSLLLAAHVVFSALISVGAMEGSRECREQEYKDRFGNCKPCKQCDAGQELSKECGFGYGEDARCVPCRSSRFKEDRSLQKCKPCLDCGLINRFQKGNCSTTSNAVCGDCLPGFYRKTKLSGFQDMECIPCGDPPPPYEPNCSGRVNLVPLPSVVTSPRDVALAAVICSALATVLLALLVLCVIYCKRQLLEKKPSASSLRSQDCPYSGAELSCLDARWLHDFPHRTCCQCHLDSGHHCGPVHLNPSLCCDESCSLGCSQDVSPFQSQMSLSDENRHQHEEDTPMWLEGHAEPECEGADEMTGSVESPEYLELPLCGVDPAGGSEEGGEEGEGLREYSCERRGEDCSDTVTDALLPKQQGQTQEG
ncbi:PREDICTED: tumor necrosis factor receptor superfamily member 19 isoform X2 [Poecilia mexicana]|uniref:TNFR-Cys domain-containing protein n=1 Tax=Poecilia mexicana TaxID=48701 RepID=A0A3B3WQ67_9TELE|nr:PREDICTED: tumor necrosis factor receptor superfamily member 19 isoform X2 [Poecilia mexicana]